MCSKPCGTFPAQYLYVSFALLFSFAFISGSASAISYYGYTYKFGYLIGDTIFYTGVTDTNISGNISLALVDSSGNSFDSKTIFPAALNFTSNLTTAPVSSSGEYYVRAAFTYNGTSYESKSMIKIHRASKFIITTDSAIYSPGGTIGVSIRAEDASGAVVSGEPVYAMLVYSNYTLVSSTSGTTDSSGSFSASFTAPGAQGSYKIVVNDGIAIKIVDVSIFDIIAFSGDASGNAKFKFGPGETAYIYVDLSTANKTSYSGQESIDVNVTYSNGTSYISSLAYGGNNRVNATYILDGRGAYSAKITALSNSKSITVNFDVADYEFDSTLRRGAEETSSFFSNGTGTLNVTLYNVTSGDIINASMGGWNVSVLDSNLNYVTNISNGTQKQSDNSYNFTFNTTSLPPGDYYLNVTMNQSSMLVGFTVQDYIAQSVPVDQDHNPKNVFVGNKQVVRVLTTLSGPIGSVNVSNISVIDVTDKDGVSIKSSLTFNNVTNVSYKGGAAGYAEFSAPTDAGWYAIKTKVNGEYESETWFLVRLYSVCASMSGFKWFASSGDDVSIDTVVTEAKDVGFIDDISKNSSSGGAGGGNSSMSGMYGMASCNSYYTTAGGTSTSGNATSGITVTVSKVLNLGTMEDVTSKISSRPTNTTDASGRATLKIPKPSGQWEGGSYLVEFSLKDKNDNTDKGFGWFQVRTLWINVWPKQNNGYWKWYFSPTENLTFDVYAYNATQTWNGWSSSMPGTGDNCTVLSIGYQGSGSEWFWPPKAVDTSKYSWTCTKVGDGRFTLAVNHTTPFQTGYYNVKVKVNTSSGTFDTGEGGFSVKAYNVYMRSSSSNYYDSWYKTPTDALQFNMDVTYANSTSYCYWGSCPSNDLAKENLNITVKKILKYDSWQQKEYNQTKYNVSFLVNGTTVNSSMANTTTGNATMIIVPAGATGKWETGYYSVVAEVTGRQGTESGTSWFEVRKFFVDVTPVSSNGTSTYAFRSDGNITLNITASSRPAWFYSYGGGSNITYYNVTVASAKLMYYSYGDYRTKTVPATLSPATINGTGIVTVIPASALASGWYWMDIVLSDSENATQTAYASFQVKDFTFNAQTANWRWEFNTTESIPINAYVCDPEQSWCSDYGGSYGGSDVAITVTKFMRTDRGPYESVPSGSWSYTTTGAANQGNNGKVNVSVTHSSPLSSGYYMAELTATRGTTSQTYSVWFNVKSFSLNAYPVAWENSIKNNVTLQVTASKAVTLSSGSVRCGYWPNEKTYTIGFNTTAVPANTPTYVMISPVGNTWASGSCYGTITASDGSATQDASVSFSMKAFSLSAYTTAYNYMKNQSVNVSVMTDAGQALNVSSITLTNSDQAPYTTYSYSAGGASTLNVSPMQITGNGTISITPSTGNWTTYGYYSGQIEFSDSQNSNVKASTWISFQIAKPLDASGWPVDANNYSASLNQSTEDIRFRISVTKLSSFSGYGVSYTSAPSINVSVAGITKENCYGQCTYTDITGYTSASAVTDGSGIAYVNVTKAGGWSYGNHRMVLQLNDTASAENTGTARIWFWVN